MTAVALLRQLAEPALNAFENTVTVTVPTRLLTALADLVEASEGVDGEAEQTTAVESKHSHGPAIIVGAHAWFANSNALAEVERAAKEHTA